MKPALDRLVASKDDAARFEATQALDAIGIGALPAIVERLSGLEKDAPDRSDLEATAARLASIVTEVVVTKDSVAPDDAFSAILKDLRDRPFDADAFVRVVLGATKGAPNGAVGLRLRASRAADLAGVTLAVTLVKDPVHGWGGNEKGWSQWSHSGPNVRVGDRRGGGKSGGMAIDHGKTVVAWKEDGAEVEQAFGAAPDVPVVVGFSVVREE